MSKIILGYCEQPAITDKGIWFVHQTIPIFFFFNFSSESITYIHEMPECIRGSSEYFRSVAVNGVIFFIPYGADKIVIFDSNENKFKTICLKIQATNREMVFDTAFYYCGWIYMIPSRHDEVIKINIETYEVKSICKWKHLLKKGKTTGDVVRWNNTLIWTMYESNEVLLFDLREESLNRTRFDGFETVCGQMLSEDNYIYLYDYENSELLKVDLEKKLVIKKKKASINHPKFYLINGLIIAVSKYDNSYACYDSEFNEVKREGGFFSDESNHFSNLSNMIYVAVNNEKSFLFHDNKVAKVQNNYISKFKTIKISCDYNPDLKYLLFKRNAICRETRDSLELFIEYLNALPQNADEDFVNEPSH